MVNRNLPPGGTIGHDLVNCLRFANPAEAIGGLEAWRFGGLEAWKGSEAWSVEITPKGWQKGSSGHPKWSPGASKMEPGASKMAPSWSNIDQDGGSEALRHPKRAKQTPGKQPGKAQGSQNGSQGAPGLPKASQNGGKMESESVPKGDQIWSAQKCRCLIDF